MDNTQGLAQLTLFEAQERALADGGFLTIDGDRMVGTLHWSAPAPVGDYAVAEFAL